MVKNPPTNAGDIRDMGLIAKSHTWLSDLAHTYMHTLLAKME